MISLNLKYKIDDTDSDFLFACLINYIAKCKQIKKNYTDFNLYAVTTI